MAAARPVRPADRHLKRAPRAAAWAGTTAALVSLPWILAAVFPNQHRYLLHIVIFTGLFASLALSYDLIVGHLGNLSLAHPAFFGIGAYAAALLATEARWPFLGSLTAAVVAPAVAALAIGAPVFRLAEHSLAIGTLGFALVTHIIILNWVELTRGPLCVTGIPRPSLGGLAITTLPQYYWLSLGVLAATALLYRALTTFRLGRAMHAIRDNEALAQAAGINPLKYRMLAFVVGAAVAGGIGALYAHYITVLCPEELTVNLTITLLVIVYLGGVGSLRGVVMGAVLFTALPEVLRVAPTWRLVIYGLLLLVTVVRAPEGLDAALRRRRVAG